MLKIICIFGFPAATWLLIIGAFLLLSGCDKNPGAVSVGTANATAPGDASERRRALLVPVEGTVNDSGLYRDTETGCQYFSSWGHGLTPRMSRYEDGAQKQMGCFETLHMVNPVGGPNK